MFKFDEEYFFKENQYDNDSLLPLIEKQFKDGLSFWGKTSVIEEFENRFAQRFSLNYCFSVNSGTSALNTAFFALNIKEDDEIICSAYGYWANLSPIFNFRAKPIFVDTNLFGNITIDEIKKQITEKTKAVIINHSFGYPNTDIRAIKNLLETKNIYLIEDCSQSFFSTFDNSTVSSFGDIAIWSLQERKFISGGEGGIISFKNRNHFELGLLFAHNRVRTLKEIQSEDLVKYNYSGTGNHFRLGAINSIIANSQLSKIDEFITNKLYFAKEMDNIFTNSSTLKPVFPFIDNIRCSYHSYPLQLLTKDFSPKTLFDKCIENNFYSLSYGKVMTDLSNLEIIKRPISNLKRHTLPNLVYKNTQFIINNYVFLPVPKTRNSESMIYLNNITKLFSNL